MSPRRTSIIGLGVTGRSCIRHLQQDELVVIDTRDAGSLLENLPSHPAMTVLTGVREYDFTGVDRIIVSPGVALGDPLLASARRAGIPLSSDIDLFMAAAMAPVFAVTGTNGKSTVTAMTGALLEAAGYRVRVGGNLGEPALDLLSPMAEFYVLELSSFQLERMAMKPFAGAVVLNVTEDHIDRHGTLDAYAAVKRSLFESAAVCVFNRADPRTVPDAAVPGRVTSFGLDAPGAGAWGRRRIDGVEWFVRGDAARLAAGELALAGVHNQANFLAACAVLDDLSLPDAALREVARAFRSLPHRCELVLESRGVRFYDDSKATNVGATIAAVNGIASALPPDGRIVLLAGGDGKGADFGPLRDLAPVLRGVVIYGRDAARLHAVLDDVVPTRCADTFESAVDKAVQLARKGDSVLLAPACASLDMFANYAERGRRFVELVRSIAI